MGKVMALVVALLCEGAWSSASYAEESQRIPNATDPTHESYFPLKALAKGLQGGATLGFNIDKKGRAKDVVLVAPGDDPSFEQAAERWLKNLRFDVGSEWSSRASERFAVKFVFALAPCDQPMQKDPGVDIVVRACSARPLIAR